MRNISFMLTTEQIRDRSKTVTRRLGWANLKPGTLLHGVVKSQGLRKGETVEKLAVIRVISVSREQLGRMLDDSDLYGQSECIREGFPHLTPAEFVEMFCRSHRGCTPDTVITRIEFQYVDDEANPCGAEEILS
jgi:hypothetical protein